MTFALELAAWFCFAALDDGDGAKPCSGCGALGVGLLEAALLVRQLRASKSRRLWASACLPSRFAGDELQLAGVAVGARADRGRFACRHHWYVLQYLLVLLSEFGYPRCMCCLPVGRSCCRVLHCQRLLTHTSVVVSSGLTNGQAVTVSVRAVTAVGSGPWANSSLVAAGVHWPTLI